MASQKAIVQFHAITAGDMSANITSPASVIQFLDKVSILLVFTGTPTGTFAVEVSGDYNNNPNSTANVGTWIPLPLSPAPVAAGAADSILIDLDALPAPNIRVVYTATSGAGSLDMYISAKGL